MKKIKTLAVGTVTLLPALAQAEPAAGAGDSNWINLIWGIVPFVFFAIIFFWILRRLQSPKNPRVKKHDAFLTRQEQHMERVEQSLERIAKALEKKD